MDSRPSLQSEPCSSIDEVKKIRGQLSLKLLKTLDQHTESILHQTPFVTAYELNADDRWSRAGVEGFLYVISRSIEPVFSFVLVNKKSENHLIEYITPEFEMNHDSNFIFYRSFNIETNTMNMIRGLWFFDVNECKTAFGKMKSIAASNKPLNYNPTSLSSSIQNPPVDLRSYPTTPRSDQTKNSSTHSGKDEISGPLDTLTISSSTNIDHKKDNKCEDSNTSSDNTVSNDSQLVVSFIKTDDVETKISSTLEKDQNSSADEAFNVMINYKMLKVAIREVINSDDFALLVWNKLMNVSNSQVVPNS